MIATISIIRRIDVHPMHYPFVTAGIDWAALFARRPEPAVAPHASR